MSDNRQSGPTEQSVESVLRSELANGDVILATARPILRHLLANVDHALFSDEVIAKIRGMMLHLARQMLFELGRQRGVTDLADFTEGRQDKIALSLLENTELLAHAHSLAIEAQIAERLNQRSGIDPVLSPILQELAASQDTVVARDAMHVLSAQARFMQQQRRMELPLGELPPDLFDTVLALFLEHTADLEGTKTQASLKKSYATENRRVGKIVSLVEAMQHKAHRALEIDHAGVSIFVTALSMASDQERGTVILSLGENQCARLALSLRASGLGQAAVEEQFMYLHPEISLPEGFDALRADHAQAMLAQAEAAKQSKGVSRG